jgi:hypothetical protein
LLRALHRIDRPRRAPAEGAAHLAQARRSLAALQQDPAAWLDWLARHELAGYCLAMSTAAGLAEELRPEVAEPLADAYRRQVRRNRRLLELLVELDQGLTQAGVHFLVLKGFLNSVRFAGGMQRRLMWDLDILILPQDLVAVMTVAAGMGLSSPAGRGLDPRALLRRMHAVEFRGKRGTVDIHWVFRNRLGMRRTYDQALRNAQPLRLAFSPEPTLNETPPGPELRAQQAQQPSQGITVQAIGDLDSLTMAALGLANDIERSHIKLRKVWDLYLILDRIDAGTDWGNWLAQLEQERCQNMVLNIFAFCLKLVDAEADCPRIATLLQRYNDKLVLSHRETIAAVMARPRQSLSNRLLMSRLQPISMARYWAWWIGTLPLRFFYGRNI